MSDDCVIRKPYQRVRFPPQCSLYWAHAHTPLNPTFVSQYETLSLTLLDSHFLNILFYFCLGNFPRGKNNTKQKSSVSCFCNYCVVLKVTLHCWTEQPHSRFVSYTLPLMTEKFPCTIPDWELEIFLKLRKQPRNRSNCNQTSGKQTKKRSWWILTCFSFRK